MMSEENTLFKVNTFSANWCILPFISDKVLLMGKTSNFAPNI